MEKEGIFISTVLRVFPVMRIGSEGSMHFYLAASTLFVGFPYTPLELGPRIDSFIVFVACRVAQQRGDSDDGSPSGTNAETPSGDDFR